MGVEYLIDTNAAIDYLDEKLPANALQLIDTHEIRISVISRIELLVWPESTTDQLAAINNFINSATVYQLDEAIILKAIEIRKKYKIKLPDAIIAATAVVNNLTFLSRNTSDFSGVAKLKLINPWKL